MDFMQSLVIVVIHYTSKKRSLVVANFVFVYIEHERFQYLSRYVKHDEGFESCRFGKTPFYMSMVLFNEIVQMFDCTMSCTSIKTLFF